MPASTNRLGLSFVKESTYGTTPTSTQSNMRFTSESLRQDTGTATSSEIQSDRQIPSVVRATVGASGDTGFEMYCGGSLEDLFHEAFLQHGAAMTDGGTITMGTGTYTIAASGGTMTAGSGTPFSTVAVGEWVKIVGMTNAGNNGYFRVTAQSNTVLTFDTNNATFVNEAIAGDASGFAITIGDYARNGTTQASYSLEKNFADLSSTFALYKGMVCDGMSLTVPTDGIVNGSFSWLGKQAANTTATADSGSHSSAGTGAVLSGIDNVAVFREGGNEMTITSFSMTASNNLRQRQEIGNAFSSSVGSGNFSLSGSFQAYFAAGDPVTSMANYLAGTDSSIQIAFTDGTNQVVFDIPACRLTSAQRVAGGQNQDIILEVGFEAFKHATLGYTLQMVTF